MPRHLFFKRLDGQHLLREGGSEEGGEGGGGERGEEGTEGGIYSAKS